MHFKNINQGMWLERREAEGDVEEVGRVNFYHIVLGNH